MLKGGKNKIPGPTNSPDQLNRIVEGTGVKGDVITDSNFRLDGNLDGTLRTTGKLVIGVTGKVDGEVNCTNADIEGEVIGNIKVEGLLLLKSTARVKGNITAGKIGIENGAEFNGNCNMGSAVVSKNGAVISEVTSSSLTEKKEENLSKEKVTL